MVPILDLATERHYSAEKSKSLCQKIVASTAWPLSEVTAHWDQLVLELRSGQTQLQEGAVSTILPPNRLLEQAASQRGLSLGKGMLFSGTVPMLTAIEPGMADFSMSLRDPVLGRVISCDFQVADATAWQGELPPVTI